MAKMKWGGDVDWEALEDEEYEEGEEFEAYDGEVPPANILLKGAVTKAWTTKSSNGNAMIKALFVADGNEGSKAQYNGCPFWENVNITLPQVKFKWQPFLDALSITLKDVKAKTVVEDEEDNVGRPVKKIGTAKFPHPVMVKTAREKYEGEWQARVGKFLPLDEELDEDDDEGDDDTPF
jgi:hypothetical protein